MKIAEDLYIENFASGAQISAKRDGLNIIIDTFRASNTILALLNHVDEVIPVSTVKEALDIDADIRVGEVRGKLPEGFDVDNSPTTIEKLGKQLVGKKVVLRSTNGTQGLLQSQGARVTIVASPRNLTATVDFASQFQGEVNLVAMGSAISGFPMPVPEDTLTAELIASLLLRRSNKTQTAKIDLFSDPSILESRIFTDIEYKSAKMSAIPKDIPYCLAVDRSTVLPVFENGSIKRL